MFACEFLKQPSVFSFEQIGLAELMLTCYLPNSWSWICLDVRWAGVSRLAGFQTSLAEINAKATGPTGPTGAPIHHRSVFSESCHIVVC